MNIWLSHVTVWEQTTLVISVKSHCIVSLLFIVHVSLSFITDIVHMYYTCTCTLMVNVS